MFYSLPIWVRLCRFCAAFARCTSSCSILCLSGSTIPIAWDLHKKQTRPSMLCFVSVLNVSSAQGPTVPVHHGRHYYSRTTSAPVCFPTQFVLPLVFPRVSSVCPCVVQLLTLRVCVSTCARVTVCRQVCYLLKCLYFYYSALQIRHG